MLGSVFKSEVQHCGGVVVCGDWWVSAGVAWSRCFWGWLLISVMISWSSFSPAYDHPGVSTPPGACLSLRPPFDPAQKPVAGGSSTLASDTGALPVLPGTERRFLSVLCSRVIRCCL